MIKYFLIYVDHRKLGNKLSSPFFNLRIYLKQFTRCITRLLLFQSMKKSQRNLSICSQVVREMKNHKENTVKLEEMLVGIQFLSVPLLKANKKPANAVTIHVCRDPLFYTHNYLNRKFLCMFYLFTALALNPYEGISPTHTTTLLIS